MASRTLTSMPGVCRIVESTNPPHKDSVHHGSNSVGLLCDIVASVYPRCHPLRHSCRRNPTKQCKYRYKHAAIGKSRRLRSKHPRHFEVAGCHAGIEALNPAHCASSRLKSGSQEAAKSFEKSQSLHTTSYRYPPILVEIYTGIGKYSARHIKSFRSPFFNSPIKGNPSEAITMDERKYVEAFAVDKAQRRTDFQHKTAALRRLLTDASLDAVVLSFAHNFAWLTGGGRSFINSATEGGVGSIYVDASQVVVISNEIEGHRLIHEELDGLQGDVKLHEDPWYDQPQALTVAKKLANGSDRIAVDAANPEIEAQIGKLRLSLTQNELQVYRALGKDCGEIIGLVSRSIRPSMSEWEVAADLSERCWKRGITPIVALIAADERVDAIRHPLPTNKRIKNKVMIVLCGRRAGFVLSCTRIVYVTTTPGASVPADLLRRHEAATYIDAVAIAASKPGAVAKDIFKLIQDAYRTKGYDGEWKLHHQGGAAGYKSREWVANPQLASAVVGLNQGFAWNPSVTGTKSEDTVLLYQGEDGKLVHEVISESPDWPLHTHTIDGEVIKRPGILHIAY